MTLDERVTADLREGRVERACTAVLRELGPEVCGYLRAVLRDEGLCDDAWARATTDLWRALPRYRGERALRGYVYRIAWHAALKVLRDPHRRRRVPWSAIEEPCSPARSHTAAHLRSDTKLELREARARLSPADQALLVLRVDRDMAWDEVAHSLGLRPAAARKRYERVRKKLRALLVERRAPRPAEPALALSAGR